MRFTSSLLILTCTLGCAAVELTRPAVEGARSPRLPPVDDEAGTRLSSVLWRTEGLSAAQAEAADSGKSLFVFITTSWCGPCKRMKEATFADRALAREMNGRLVPIMLDGERGEGKALCDARHINSYPTMIFQDPSGGEVDRAFGYHDPTRLHQVIGDMLADRNTVGDLRRRVAEAPAVWSLRQSLGLRLALRGDTEEALIHLDKVIAADPDDALGLASQALFVKGRYVHYLKTHNLDEAVQAFGQLLERFPKSASARDGALDLARIRVMRGLKPQAEAALQAMVDAVPDDPQRAMDAAALARQQGLDPVLASTWAERAAEHRGDVYPLLLAAELAELAKDPARALRLLRRALERAPNDRVINASIQRLQAALRTGGTAI